MSVFNEQSLYDDIVAKWGEYGAHAEVFRMMLAKIEQHSPAEGSSTDKPQEG